MPLRITSCCRSWVGRLMMTVPLVFPFFFLSSWVLSSWSHRHHSFICPANLSFLTNYHVVRPPSQEAKNRADRFGSHFTSDSTQSEVIYSRKVTAKRPKWHWSKAWCWTNWWSALSMMSVFLLFLSLGLFLAALTFRWRQASTSTKMIGLVWCHCMQSLGDLFCWSFIFVCIMTSMQIEWSHYADLWIVDDVVMMISWLFLTIFYVYNIYRKPFFR